MHSSVNIDCPLFTYTVGTYSPGKAFVVYEIKRHVFPTALLMYDTCQLYIHLVIGYMMAGEP